MQLGATKLQRVGIYALSARGDQFEIGTLFNFFLLFRFCVYVWFGIVYT